MYVYAHKTFTLADQGVNYLTRLANEDSEKLNNDPQVMEVLKGRDLPNMIAFVSQHSKVKSILSVAIIINIINYALYPYNILIYSWMAYMIVAACVVTSIDAILMFFNLRRNKQTVDAICNAYYDLTLTYDRIDASLVSIETAFEQMMQDLDNLNKSTTVKDKNDDDEK